MDLKEFFCGYFELSISFSITEFDKEAFLDDVKPSEDKRNKDQFSFMYGSQEHPGEQHAHLAISFRSDENCLARLSYSRSPEEVEDKRPPFMENFSQWLGQFFKPEMVVAEIDASFDFSDDYTPVIVLPFPVMSEHEILAGASVMGVSLEFPEESNLHYAIIQRADNGTWLSLKGMTEMKTAAMDAHAALKEVFLLANKLVKGTGNTK